MPTRVAHPAWTAPGARPHNASEDEIPLLITIKPRDLPRRLIMAWDADLVPIIHGGPGIGKTRIHYQTASKLGIPCIPIRAATREPTAIAGMPIPDLKQNFIRWMVDEMWPSEPCVWFFDELNRAPTLTQNACFQLFDEKRIGGATLPEGTRLSVAVNRESDGGGVIRMPQALNNRFVHFNLETDAESWREWAYTADIDPMIIAFIAWRPECLYCFNRDDQAWPSPRQWEFLSKIVKQEPDHQTLKEFVYGTVGHTVSSEFLAFAEQYRAMININIDKILTDPEGAAVPREASAIYAVASALSDRVDVKTFGKILTYMRRLPDEYNVFCIRLATRRDSKLKSTAEFVQWAVEFQDVI